jgi:hypothetical protein
MKYWKTRGAALRLRLLAIVTELVIKLRRQNLLRNTPPRFTLRFTSYATLLLVACMAVLVTGTTPASDPGPRPGAAGAGSFYPTLNADEQQRFSDALDSFTESNDQVVRGPDSGGLGPGFNSNSCSSCHSQPATLGSSPSPASPQVPQPNPQIAAGLSMGAKNVIPSFITADGPVREARFVRNHDGTPDGGVHDLFSIAGRTDAPGCTFPQPNFAGHLAAHNVVFRIPTPVFGLGLVENTTDNVLKANLAANAHDKRELGIHGRFNTSGNDGTITKFGWKAQNKSLMIFAGEAYNVEMGITNDNFPDERNINPGQNCAFNTTPEDSHPDSDIEAFQDAMRLSAPPTPAAATTSATRGQQAFNNIGCVLCHSDTLTTAGSGFTGMSFVKYHPFSDFALHHMGTNLADGVNQGAAGGDEFRTAPLWGVGQRLFFLHDGRTHDLNVAIETHYGYGSEANRVVNNYNRLNTQQRQDLLNFLRSL